MRRLNLYYTALERGDAGALFANGGALLAGIRTPAAAAWRSRCEQTMASLTGAAAAYAFPSARSALLALLQAIRIGRGDEVLVTGFTCVAVPAPIVYAGARPVYVDIAARTFNMDPTRLEARITPRTRAIVAQHTFGNPADIPEILRIARRHGLPVIEDCAPALGSRYAGRPVGSYGDAGIVSFELSKTLSAGWGGLAWTNDAGLAERIRAVHGRCRPSSRGRAARLSFQVALSYPLYHPRGFWIGRYLAALLYRAGVFRVSTPDDEVHGRMPRDYFEHLSDEHWGVIVRQLTRLDRIVEHGRRLFGAYREVLDRHRHPTYPEVLVGAAPAWIRFPFLVADREGMKRFFGRRGIEVGQWFDAPVSGAGDPSVFAYDAGACPTAERVCRHVVNLPTSVRVTDADLRRITAALDEYLTRHPENQEFVPAAHQADGRPAALRGAG